MNKVIMLGRLTKDVEVRYTQAAEPLAVARFAIAVDRPFKREGAPEADFFNCVCFGKRGENISKFFRKGSKIAISGRLENNNWTDKDGQKRYDIVVNVEDFDFCESKGGNAAPQQTQQTPPHLQGEMPLTEDDGDDSLPF